MANVRTMIHNMNIEMVTIRSMIHNMYIINNLIITKKGMRLTNWLNGKFSMYELFGMSPVNAYEIKITITALTIKSALKKSWINEKSVAPPSPTTCVATSCSIRVNVHLNVS